jgi:hypothetical protein
MQHWPQPSHSDSHSACDIAVSDLVSQNGAVSAGSGLGLRRTLGLLIGCVIEDLL